MRRDAERKTYFLKKRKRNFWANVRLRGDRLEVAGEIIFMMPRFFDLSGIWPDRPSETIRLICFQSVCT
jgi:hypothetical protein